jgi:hypothetical protein
LGVGRSSSFLLWLALGFAAQSSAFLIHGVNDWRLERERERERERASMEEELLLKTVAK